MTFREQFITEKNNSSGVIINRIIDFNLPLSPKMFEDVFENPEAIYLHTTVYTNIERLKKIQNTKKGVSCFTKWANNEIFSTGADGISNDNMPMTFVLKGRFTIDANEDIWTVPDEQGRRWVITNDIQDMGLIRLFREIGEDVKKQMIKKYPLFKEARYYVIDGLDKITGKEREKLIKDYFDISKKVLTKYKKEITAIRYQETKAYNEIIGYDFEIVDALMTREAYRAASPHHQNLLKRTYDVKVKPNIDVLAERASDAIEYYEKKLGIK